MTFLRYEPGVKGYKFMWLTNTAFLASMATFDEHLFPCCPEAKTPSMTILGDRSPSDYEDSHGTPRDENDNHPSGPSLGNHYSDDHSTPQGPSSPGPSNTDSSKDEILMIFMVQIYQVIKLCMIMLWMILLVLPQDNCLKNHWFLGHPCNLQTLSLIQEIEMNGTKSHIDLVDLGTSPIILVMSMVNNASLQI